MIDRNAILLGLIAGKNRIAIDERSRLNKLVACAVTDRNRRGIAIEFDGTFTVVGDGCGDGPVKITILGNAWLRELQAGDIQCAERLYADITGTTIVGVISDWQSGGIVQAGSEAGDSGDSGAAAGLRDRERQRAGRARAESVAALIKSNWLANRVLTGHIHAADKQPLKC